MGRGKGGTRAVRAPHPHQFPLALHQCYFWYMLTSWYIWHLMVVHSIFLVLSLMSLSDIDNHKIKKMDTFGYLSSKRVEFTQDSSTSFLIKQD